MLINGTDITYAQVTGTFAEIQGLPAGPTTLQIALLPHDSKHTEGVATLSLEDSNPRGGHSAFQTMMSSSSQRIFFANDQETETAHGSLSHETFFTVRRPEVFVAFASAEPLEGQMDMLRVTVKVRDASRQPKCLSLLRLLQLCPWTDGLTWSG